MVQESTTVARPYAEAVFARAEETSRLDLWSDQLALLAAIVEAPELQAVLDNPQLSAAQVAELVLDVASDGFDSEGRNLVRLLAGNGRLEVAAEIRALYERLKQERQGHIQVEVRSAYALKAAERKALEKVLARNLRREVEIHAEKDPSLIGGVLIRAGDLVIDGSVRGQLQNLANELSI